MFIAICSGYVRGTCTLRAKEGIKMTQILKTLILISLLASVSIYACEWKNGKKKMTLTSAEAVKTYSSSWSDAQNSRLLQFTAEDRKVKAKTADNKVAAQASVN
jgi:predicted secreted protein